MQKNKKLIDLHKEWCQTNKLHDWGLCHSIPKRYKKSLKLFVPNKREVALLIKEKTPQGFWGYDKPTHCTGYLLEEYTQRRQNIVLLICAMHDEL